MPLNILFFCRRRSPKRIAASVNAPASNPEVEPEKLTQEAYRLLRTVQNLLNTQEPILNAMHEPKYIADVDLFDRKTQSRESRLSIRSGTDDSMHSGSSKHETTDEDNTDRPSPELPVPPPPQMHRHPCVATAASTTNSGATTMNDRIKEGHAHHLIDDESGFSSMNSFQEIGLPLVNSTMRSPGSSAASTSSEASTEMENTTKIENNKERTLVASSQHREKVGLPQVSHRRWDSVPITSPRLQLANESASQVLWV